MKKAYTILALLLTSFLFAQEAPQRPYLGGELYSLDSWLYGKIEVRMKTAKGSGILSTFFTYKYLSEQKDVFWEEIDIEVFGKNDGKTWQSNILTDQPTGTEEKHTAPYSFADQFHVYTLEWKPGMVKWKVDGKTIRTEKGLKASQLKEPQSFRFNLWAAFSEGWVGPFDDSVLPVYQYIDYIKYYRLEDNKFVFDWEDQFYDFNEKRWAKANWTFDENRVQFSPDNVNVKNGFLVLSLTKVDTDK